MSVGGATGLPEKIGKYRVVDRIGRGGMGMIFKAHDPILDRQVALKVISPEVEVTDELRTRFFREAQACAKLNHPNIVTVFDMGEDNGRLFIVMELLEGEELRRLIAQRTALTFEEKLSVMLQVCGGLHYAHQMGIVHRDMKPGNIFRLKNGQVKILDFGIAHIASADPGLTRTGLIMGTLRYISPEQLRGRVDHRSDMFSIGSVFYELLTSRPPFLGEDPMQLLEQLRTEEPPAPTEIDPTIPAELTVIVQRAMRKNPDERFHDLEEMRSELELVHRTLIEERQRVVARVRRQRERIVQLRAALAERIGSPGADDRVQTITDRSALVTAQSTEREFAALVETLEAKIARADALAPAVQHAQELLVAGRFEDAVERFEAIVADIPEHRLAGEGLARARAEAEANRQRELATDILQRAQAALDDRRYELCLEIVKEAMATALPADTTEAITSLGHAAEAGLAEQEKLRLARQTIEAAQAGMAKARADAQAEEAPQHAPGVWNEAETAAAAAQADLGREAYVEAERGFEKAALIYRRSLDVARQARVEERRTVERERDMARQGQNQARAVGATQYAKDLWAAAEGRFAEAQAIFARKPSAPAGSAFTEASALYHRAEAAAREVREREHRRADAARERAMEGQRSAATVDAEHRTPAVWQDAVRKSTEGEAALLRQQYATGAEAFEAALALYHQAQAQVRELARRQREDARKKQEEMADRRRGAAAVEAASQAAVDWKEAEASAATGDRALGREAWEDAGRAFDEAATLYQRAEEHSRDAVQARAEAKKAVETTGLARSAAAKAGAAIYAPQALQEAESAEAHAVATLDRQQFAAARPLFDEAGRLYAAAARAAGVAAEAKRAEEAAEPAQAAERQRDPAPLVQPSSTGRTVAPAEFDDAATVFLRSSDLVKPPTVSDDREEATVLAARPLESEVGQDIPPRLPRLKARARDAMGVGSWRLKVGGLLVVAIGGVILVVFAIWRAPLSPPDTTRTISAPTEPAPAKPPTPRESPGKSASEPRVDLPPRPEPDTPAVAKTEPDKGAAERAAAERAAAKVAADKAAADRVAAKVAADKAAADRVAAKVAADKAAADRAAAEKVAAEKAAAERAAAKAAADKAAAEKVAAEKAAADRAAAEKAAADRAAAEKAAADKVAAVRRDAEQTAMRELKAQAEAARKGMLNEKQLAESRGGQDSTEFKAAVGAEKQALSLYEQLAYKEAAEKFRAAETQFKQTPAKRRSFGPTF